MHGDGLEYRCPRRLHGDVGLGDPGSYVTEVLLAGAGHHVTQHKHSIFLVELKLEFLVGPEANFLSFFVAWMANPRVKRKITKKKASNGRRSTADKVQAQGTGKAVRVAFGGGGNGKTKSVVPRLPAGCWDAFNQAHAALPRAVGPYTVVRTTRLINTTSRFALVGTFTRFGYTSGTNDSVPLWTDICCATEAAPTGAIGSTAATRFHNIPMPIADTLSGSAGAGTLCPSAISVQVLGNQSLQQAHGQLAAAVCPVRLDLRGTTRSWGDIENKFISYFRPRLMSAGKLVLRGVQMDSHPLSMADVSEFRGVHTTNADDPPGDILPASWSLADAPYDPTGWAPMVIYNPDNTSLSLLITIEWRVRFDLSNPAVSSHTHHGVSSDVSWEKHIAAATRQLPGVIDIVEKVASTGVSIASMLRG